MTHYGGDAGGIWSDEPRADELQRRFDAFLGIGQKKAAMAVEILERDMGVPIKALERSDAPTTYISGESSCVHVWPTGTSATT